MIKPDKLQLAIEGKIDSLAWLTNHFHFSNPICRPFWVMGLRLFWDQLEPTLTDPKTILKTLMTRKDIAPIISTPEGIYWLNSFAALMYHFLRLYTYGSRCVFCYFPLDACNDAWVKLSGPGLFSHKFCHEAFEKAMSQNVAA